MRRLLDQRQGARAAGLAVHGARLARAAQVHPEGFTPQPPHAAGGAPPPQPPIRKAGSSNPSCARWDTSARIGLPLYDKSWGSIRFGVSKFSDEWRSFHEQWVAPELDAQKEASSKRQKSADGDLLSNLPDDELVDLSEATFGQARADENERSYEDDGKDHRFEGNVHVSG